ncbi:MAG: hypothetical protein ACJA0T_000288 [Colwellia sp.]|jgi:hypothetical protein
MKKMIAPETVVPSISRRDQKLGFVNVLFVMLIPTNERLAIIRSNYLLILITESRYIPATNQDACL